MARYDLYRIDDTVVVDLQSDIVDIPGSRVVAPLFPVSSAPSKTKGLHPEVMVNGVPYLVATHLIATTPTSLLTAPFDNIVGVADEIARALDVLFQGF